MSTPNDGGPAWASARGDAELARIGYEAARRYWNPLHPDAPMPPWHVVDAERAGVWVEMVKAIRAELAKAPTT